MRPWNSLICVVLAFAPLVGAQVQDTYPLETVSIQGNDQFPAERIIAASGLKIGQSVVKRDFDQARDRLIATGAFESVGYEYKPGRTGTGYDAVLQVVEARPLYRYRFDGLPGTEASLREALRKQEPIFADKIPATPLVMNRYSEALAAFLANGTEVKGDINADVPGELMIVFHPVGARANISSVVFRGNQVLPSPELNRVISGVAIGVPYSEPLFRRMLDQSIRPLYEERGRIRVTFGEVTTAKSRDNEGIVVTVEINEGESYNLGEVRLEGASLAQSTELTKEAGWRTGAIANFTEIKASMDRIRRKFQTQGYLRVDSLVEREIKDDEHIVNLVVKIDPGPRFTMGKLKIVGLNILTEPVIRKLWMLKEGDPYNDQYADALLKRIQDEGYFDNLQRTGAEAEIHDDTRTVDVTLTFQGGRLAPEDDRKRDRRR
jgi:outer membrane protein insertion porin family